MIRCGSKRPKRHVFKREWIPCSNFLTSLDLIVKINGGTYMSSIMNKIFIIVPNFEANGYGHSSDLAIISCKL